MTACIHCDGTDTELYKADDGHYRKRCHACGHVGGPYTSNQSASRQGRSQQSQSLDEY